MTINYLILLLPLVCTGFEHYGITIEMKLAPTEADVTIERSGEDVQVATDSDLAAFNLTKDNLDDAVTTYSGERPTDIFTRSPTPWDDLYIKYNWAEVQREFKIKDIKLVNVSIEKKKIGVRYYRNNETEVDIKERLNIPYGDFLSEHYWSGNDKVSASVKYLLRRPYLPFPLEYGSLSKVGETRFETGIYVVAYANVGATFKLQPRQRANMYLEATAVVTRVSVEYETVLSGNVVANYENKHAGHHFWAYDVNKVLDASNMTKKVVSKEIVEIEYIKDFKTKVVDVSTGVDIQFTV